MDRRELTAALEDLADLLQARRTTARIYIVGGAAMAMAYDSDRFTHDIDGVILDSHTVVTRAVHEVARRRGLPTYWLNEQASSYLPRGQDRRGLVVFDHPALRVTAASPERLLAMKVMAGRPADIPDIRLLVEILGRTTPEETLETVASIYPDEPVSERSRAAIGIVFGE